MVGLGGGGLGATAGNLVVEQPGLARCALTRPCDMWCSGLHITMDVGGLHGGPRRLARLSCNLSNLPSTHHCCSCSSSVS